MRLIAKHRTHYEVSFEDLSAFEKELKILRSGISYVPKVLDYNLDELTIMICQIKGQTVQSAINSGAYPYEGLIRSCVDMLVDFQRDIDSIDFERFDYGSFKRDFIAQYYQATKVKLKRAPGIEPEKSHGDFHTENILFDGRRIYLIDFANTGWVPRGIDLVKLVGNGSLRVPDHARERLFNWGSDKLSVDRNQLRSVQQYEFARLYNRLCNMADSDLEPTERVQKRDMLNYLTKKIPCK